MSCIREASCSIREKDIIHVYDHRKLCSQSLITALRKGGRQSFFRNSDAFHPDVARISGHSKTKTTTDFQEAREKEKKTELLQVKQPI